ncbi:MAG: bifunctional 3-demethylubiquinol 3-O-methyltransferase/2-polyprenyl-6-hydroxyphenol methylase [Burkholderiales bacterium]|jgi:2-polyprenyl-6-hydroxyphenyl methylase/3-demethylubiquinone-9 3-methyltransferase|nr:bifunctional 3-demethylubiquinol 3-O-methyltransferase/2-polyprenyl-6-hydroxyphenol methylase [Burkholderiales bacterium]
MNVHQHEVDKFNALAHNWWNVEGEFKTLHHINPTRVQFIQSHIDLSGKNVIDVGCGGGILSESLAVAGANVTGIDLAPGLIEIAKLHLHESNLTVNYECINVADKAAQCAGIFDIVTCMELLEHVPDPMDIIQNCAKLLKPGGVAFFSTLNRTLKGYALGVLAAEYILKLVPKGTHNYAQFIKPSELRCMLSQCGLNMVDIKGLDYNPFNHTAKISKDTTINYMVATHRL